MLSGVLSGCDGDDHDEAHHARGCCVSMRERKPHDMALVAQFLDSGFAGDYVLIRGTLAAVTNDVVSDRRWQCRRVHPDARCPIMGCGAWEERVLQCRSKPSRSRSP